MVRVFTLIVIYKLQHSFIVVLYEQVSVYDRKCSRHFNGYHHKTRKLGKIDTHQKLRRIMASHEWYRIKYPGTYSYPAEPLQAQHIRQNPNSQSFLSGPEVQYLQPWVVVLCRGLWKSSWSFPRSMTKSSSGRAVVCFEESWTHGRTVDLASVSEQPRLACSRRWCQWSFRLFCWQE